MTNPPDKGWDTTIPGVESLGGMVVNAVEAYDRTLNLAKGWFEGILATQKEQAEGYTTMLRSVDASLRALEQVIEAQAKITKALGDSLDASRQVVTAATSSHQQSTERVENFVEEVLAVLNSQLQALKTQVDIGQAMLSNPLSTQSAMALKVIQDWSDAYRRMLSATSPFRPSAHD